MGGCPGIPYGFRHDQSAVSVGADRDHLHQSVQRRAVYWADLDAHVGAARFLVCLQVA